MGTASCCPCPGEQMENCKKGGGVCALISVIVIVGLLFTVPTIIHFTPGPSQKSSSQNASSDPDHVVCVQEVYEGVCTDHLLQLVYQNCNSNTITANSSMERGVVYIPSGQADREDTARDILTALSGFNLSVECEGELLPYLCLDLFGVCTDSGEVVRPSSGQCERLRTGVCAAEWVRAEALVSSLPAEAVDQFSFLQCATQPNSLTCDLPSINSTWTNTSNSTNSSITVRECSPDFYLNETGFCRPLCGEWQQYSDTTTIVVVTIVLLCASVFILVTSVVLVLSCIQYKRMLRLPGVLIVYQLIPASVLQVIWIVGCIDMKSLYCSHRDYLETVFDPTPFCFTAGCLMQYVSLYMTLMWLCHTLSMLLAINFPFQYRCLLEDPKRSRYIHATVLLVCSLLPAVTVGCGLALGDYISLLSPVYAYCTSEDPDTAYYLQILPFSIVCAVGVTGLVLIFWSLTMKHRKRHQGGNSYIKAEFKVLIAFLCYTFVAILGITTITITIQHYGKFQRELTNYFKCESTGISPEKTCSRSGFESVDFTPYVNIFTEIALTVYQMVTLVYIVNIDEIKTGILKFLRMIEKNKYHDRHPQRGAKSGNDEIQGSHSTLL